MILSADEDYNKDSTWLRTASRFGTRNLNGDNMFGLGTTELLIIFAVIILLFGARKLPELTSSLAKSIKTFRKEMHQQEVPVKKEDNQYKS